MDILLIDDHPVFSSGLKELIASVYPDLEVRTCTSLQEARFILKEDSCRLALLDLDLGGYSALDHISATTSIPMLQNLCVLSATADYSQIEECMLAGASGFISKNYSPDLVLAAIKTVLERGGYYSKRSI